MIQDEGRRRLSPAFDRKKSATRRSDEHLGNTRDGIPPTITTTTTTTAVAPLPGQITVITPDTNTGRRRPRGTAGQATSHAHSLADEAACVAGGGLGGYAEEALDGVGDAQAEAGEEGGQDAAADEGHDDEEEDLPGVALGPVGEVAEEALELLVGAVEEAVAGGALVVGRFAWDLLGGEKEREGEEEWRTEAKEAATATVAIVAETKERCA